MIKVLKVVCIAGLVAGVILALATFVAMRDVPTNLAELTQNGKRPQLLDRDGRPLTITYQNRWNLHDQRSLHEVPSLLQQAFILAEDKRFYQHSGIDWLARFNAVLQNIMALEGIRGASTISEQVVRMVHSRQRSIWARWLEGWEASALERRVDKASILEFYLNQVPYAAQRRGVQQAARYYFDRDLNTLSEKEMLALAVLVRAPSRFDLYKSTQRIQGRLNTLINRAAQQTLIADGETTSASTLQVQPPRALPNAAHFARHVYKQLRDTQSDSANQVRTTLDSKLQTIAGKLLNDRLKKLASKSVENAGMIVLDHHTNDILVWAVGENDNHIGTEFDTVLNPRQPGSTLKPFVYAAAMRKGWNAATLIDDSPLREGVGRGVHQYRNYSNAYYGTVSLRNALGNSLNIPAIKAAKYVGLSSLLTTFNELGISELDLRSVDYGNGIALGNGEVSLYSMARAYAVLARQGVYQDLKLIADSALATPKPVFSKEVSSVIGNILSDADARSLEFGRGGNLNLPVQTAVKTGTSNDYRDAWVFGFNHRYLVGVWMGNVSSEPMQGITGSKGPAPVMRSMFAELNKLGRTRALYLSPELVQRKVCVETGLIADQQCASRQEYFVSSDTMVSTPSNEISQKARLVNPSQVTIPGTQNEPRTENTPLYYLTSPIDQTQMAYDPRIPIELQQAEFKLNTDKGVERVEWYVNNELISVTNGEPHLWAIARGEYRMMAKVFDGNSDTPKLLSASYWVK